MSIRLLHTACACCRNFTILWNLTSDLGHLKRSILWSLPYQFLLPPWASGKTFAHPALPSVCPYLSLCPALILTPDRTLIIHLQQVLYYKNIFIKPVLKWKHVLKLFAGSAILQTKIYFLPCVLNYMSSPGFTRLADLTWIKVFNGVADLLTANVVNSGRIQLNSSNPEGPATLLLNLLLHFIEFPSWFLFRT